MIQKTEQNWYPQKTSNNDAPGVPRWSQNGSELIEQIWKILKIDPKTCFLRNRSFDDFLGGQKTFPGRNNLKKEAQGERRERASIALFAPGRKPLGR